MRALLDVNVLIALLDPDHTLHRRASDWLAGNGNDGWASCPITENGCIRIMSHHGYPKSHPAPAVIARLREACMNRRHEFWPDDLTLLDDRAVDSARIHGPRQVTDIYLLALAVRHGGRFVTFDNAIAHQAVKGAESHHLVVL